MIFFLDYNVLFHGDFKKSVKNLKIFAPGGPGYLGWVPPGAKNFFSVASKLWAQNFERDIQQLPFDTSNSHLVGVFAEIFQLKIWLYPQILKTKNGHISAPRAPRQKKFWGFNCLTRDYLWAKYDQNRCHASVMSGDLSWIYPMKTHLHDSPNQATLRITHTGCSRNLKFGMDVCQGSSFGAHEGIFEFLFLS